MQHKRKSSLRYGNTGREQRTNNYIQYNAKAKKKQERKELLEDIAGVLMILGIGIGFLLLLAIGGVPA